MFPTDPDQISGLPSEKKSIIFGSVVGVSTVILGNSLLKISPLSSKNGIELLNVFIINIKITICRADSFNSGRSTRWHRWDVNETRC